MKVGRTWLRRVFLPAVWVLGFCLPTAACGLARITGADAYLPGGLIYVVPIIGLGLCSCAIALSRNSAAAKTALIAATVAAMGCQFVLNVLIFGWLSIMEDGLTGMQ